MQSFQHFFFLLTTSCWIKKVCQKVSRMPFGRWQDKHLNSFPWLCNNIFFSSISSCWHEMVNLVLSSFDFLPLVSLEGRKKTKKKTHTKNTFAILSCERRATPKSIRDGSRGMCEGTSQEAETLWQRRFSFPHPSFQKQKNSWENQGRTSPRATTDAATPTSLS